MRGERYRLWMVEVGEWQGRAWGELPTRGRVLEPADADTLNAAEATAFVKAFNGAMLAGAGGGLWVVSVPVEIEWRGDLRAGERLEGVVARLVDFGNAVERKNFPKPVAMTEVVG